MATIALIILTGRPKVDGTFAIKFRISNGTSVAYITTQYSVEKKQWNGAQVVRHPQAAMINARLSQMLCAYQAKLDELDPPKNIPASKIRGWLESDAAPGKESFTTLAEKYIARLKENNQKSYAQNMVYTVKAIVDCFGDNVRLKDFSYIALELFDNHLRKSY